MLHIDQITVKNRILAALPPFEFAQIAKHLVRVDMALGETLQRAGDTIQHVYFVESGFISVVAVLSDGAAIETGLIGVEGVAGVSVILGAAASYGDAMCQTGGTAYRVPTAAFKDVAAHAPHLKDLLLRHVYVFGVQGVANNGVQRAS